MARLAVSSTPAASGVCTWQALGCPGACPRQAKLRQSARLIALSRFVHMRVPVALFLTLAALCPLALQAARPDQPRGQYLVERDDRSGLEPQRGRALSGGVPTWPPRVFGGPDTCSCGLWGRTTLETTRGGAPQRSGRTRPKGAKLPPGGGTAVRQALRGAGAVRRLPPPNHQPVCLGAGPLVV